MKAEQLYSNFVMSLEGIKIAYKNLLDQLIAKQKRIEELELEISKMKTED